MSEAGISNLMSSGVGTDLPATQEAAAEELAARKADPAFTKRYLAGDHEARARMNSLHEILSRPRDTVTGDNPAHGERTISAISEFASLSPEVEAQMRAGTPVSPDEYKRAVAMRAQLPADQDWTAKYLRGDREARKQMTLLSIVLASKLTLQQKGK